MVADSWTPEQLKVGWVMRVKAVFDMVADEGLLAFAGHGRGREPQSKAVLQAAWLG
jgi:hypothetical protein